ncbi:MAG: hypothetical protein CMQ38_12755 [Gammaproteobacteria bacterium]|nr:hypothetical protein [Gammaproteobacteria bacterium]|tara:strand:- start:714 stop:1154 length:441 start_codon:yes stop_codon:yes gene_type:complete
MAIRELEVVGFTENSYGKTIGFIEEDLILSFNGEELYTVDELRERIKTNTASKVIYTVLRNNQVITISGESIPLGIRFNPQTSSNQSKPSISVSNSEVAVIDIKMPFGSMVVFMVKWAIAAIPAFIILFFLFTFFMGLLGSFIASQ